ncbi:hypothetical protein CHARACLAT_033559 [Characodon lateralis]|uniref:Uncharacterized protein n=1 Tax=Characodon lateralis TaxID=208331 RepID=A0ABU7CTE8_9TELE|nr:hypothetical protein [Characodon lateralis]
MFGSRYRSQPSPELFSSVGCFLTLEVSDLFSRPRQEDPADWVLGTSHPEPVLLGHRRLVRAHRGKEGSGAAIRTASDTRRKMFGSVDGSWIFWSTRSDRGFISSMKFMH